MKLAGLRRLWLQPPVLALAAAAFLVAAGAVGALFAERDFHAQNLQQARAHARVLAASVGAALAFHDAAEAQQAVAALSVARRVDAIGVYTTDGALFAGWAREGEPPRRLTWREPIGVAGGFAVAAEPVLQNQTPLGWVYVRLSEGSMATRWGRHVGVGLMLVMASLLVGVIAVAHREQERANVELARRADALAESNVQLTAEVSERKKAQTALAQSQKMEAIGQLTGGIAHDFNNLLMVISSGLRLLETREDEKKRGVVVNAMRQAVDRGSGLTKQLLAFSRRQKLSPEVMIVQERLRQLRPLLERSLRADIVVEFDFSDEPAAVKVDPGQFDLAILNLAVNARDAMPGGGSFTLRVAKSEDAAAVSVIDTGVGMTPEVQARAFDPFFTTKEVGKGTGLGLSQVYGFALQSGGQCELASELGHGTMVTMVLPLTDEPLPATEGRSHEDVRGSGSVLVVEDDENVASMVSDMLGDLGYTPVRASDASEALAKLESGAAIDLVFTDIIMPGAMNGVDLARELRRRRPELPILLTTGYGGREELDTVGFPILRKPYDREELGAAIGRLRASASRPPREAHPSVHR